LSENQQIANPDQIASSLNSQPVSAITQAGILSPAIIDNILTHIRQSRAPPAQAQRSVSQKNPNQHKHRNA
jgi:hypothetical protein